MKRNLITIIAVLSATAVAGIASAQTKVGYRITIPASSRVYKFTEAKGCGDTIKKGTEIKKETIKSVGSTTYTFTDKTTPKSDTILLLPKKIKRDLSGDADGRANVYIDEKDKSLLHINYWLNAQHKLSKDTKIKQTLRTLKCNEIYEEKTAEHKLKADSTVQLWKVKLEDWPTAQTKKWATTADEVIEVLDKDGKTSYYLVNRYDRQADYQLKLNNREMISYSSSWIEYGPIIIPVKYRFQRTKDGKVAKDQFQSDLNIGIYGGYNTGKYRLRNDGGTLRELSPLALSFGGFLNVGTASIDSLFTNLSDKPLAKDETSSIGLISPGVGAMFSIHNLQVGLYSGVDFGIGKSARRWNYNNRLWIGFGVAYNVAGFWKK